MECLFCWVKGKHEYCEHLGFLGSPFSDPRIASVFDLELSISSNGSSEKIPIVPVVIFIPCRMPLPKHFRGFLLF